MHEVERMQLMQTLISWSKQSKGRSPEKKMLSFGFCGQNPNESISFSGERPLLGLLNQK